MLTLFLCVNSCTKEPAHNPDASPKALIEQSKAFFEKSVFDATKNSSTTTSTAGKNLRQLMAKEPLWKEAQVKKISVGDAVIVPLHYEKGSPYMKAGKKKYALALDNISYLMMYKNREGKMQTEVVTWMPGDDYWDDKNRSKKAFIGTVLVDDWQGNFLKGYRYSKDGKIQSVISTAMKKTGMSASSVMVDCITTDWYTCGGDWCTYNYTETICSYDFGGGSSDGGGSSGGNIPVSEGGGVTAPSDYPPTNPNSGCGPAYNGLSVSMIAPGVICDPVTEPAPTPALLFLTQIDDTNLSPCMKAILAAIKNLSNGSVAGIIQQFAGTTPGFNWTLKDGTLQQTTNAETSPIYNSTTGTVTTTFDSQKFINGSDLAVARTILHESVHAYLVAYFKLNKPGFVANYPTMVQEWGTYNNWNAVHHEEFARSLVGSIAISLQEYAVNKGYNITDPNYFNDMAWGGLSGTTAFNQMSLAEKNRINNLLSSEQSGYNLSNSYVGFKGVPSGCF